MKYLFLVGSIAFTTFSSLAQNSLKQEQIAMGNPSNAGSISNNFLMMKDQYALSYNADEGKPNWVSWHLDRSWIGDIDRQNDFRPDSGLPTSMYHVTATDYSGSGFDRGHNCPSHDRTSSEDDNSMTFLMTNMMPQAPRNNQVTWQSFEKYCNEDLVANGGKELYIICGSYGEGGTGKNGFAKTIANGKVIVPAHIWKIVLVLDEGQNDLKRIDKDTRVIAINTPNVNTIDQDWHKYLTTVDNIENATGYDFFSNVPKSIQDIIESRLDNEPVIFDNVKFILPSQILHDTDSTVKRSIYINCMQANPQAYDSCTGQPVFLFCIILFIGLGLCILFYIIIQKRRNKIRGKEFKIKLYNSILEMLPQVTMRDETAWIIERLLLVHSSAKICETFKMELDMLRKREKEFKNEDFAQFLELIRKDIYEK